MRMLRRSFAFLLLAVATTRLVAQEPAESNALEKEPYGSFVPAPKFAKAVARAKIPLTRPVS